jgi:hypothetical protein
MFHLIGRLADTTPLVIGGVTLTPGSAPSGGNANYRFLPDGTHPGTVAQGLMGNAFLQAIDRGYGESLTLQSDLKILGNASLVGSGSGAFDVSPYVILPEPGTWILLAIGCVGLLVARLTLASSVP